MGSFYKKHPRLTVFLFNAIIIFGITLLAEAYFKSKFKDPHVQYKNTGTERAVRLREGRPFADVYITPNDDIIGRSDNLEQKPFLHRYDKDGFLLPNVGHKNPEAEVYFLGGSTTMCSFNDETIRFPYLSGKLATEKTGKKINTFNAAHSNNNSLHSLNILLNKILPKKPSHVVMMHNCNDFLTLSSYGGYWNENSGSFSPVIKMPGSNRNFTSAIISIKDWLYPNLYHAIENAVSQKNNLVNNDANFKKEYMGDKFYKELFSKNLNLFIAICRATGAEPILMTQAHRLLEQPDPAIQKYYEFMAGPYEHKTPLSYHLFRKLEIVFNETIRNIGAENDVTVIDLEKNIPANNNYMYDPYHLTDEGCKMAAGIISDSLLAILANRPFPKN